ncbi:hypothetical protein MMC09_000824 [Bachmanniomyces sp. S44760]|nr:hypothetical protein [Bachmanniomyces sp. S44760]
MPLQTIAIVIGGQDADVGIGGYLTGGDHLTGGGHSPVSAYYGLGADNVLELQVITPTGELKTLNQCSNEDFFFAFRGGGGSSFGVIISATLKAYATPSLSWSHFTINQENIENDTFWQAVAYYHSQLPHLVQSGLVGYYNITAYPNPLDFTSPYRQVSGGLWVLNTNISALDAIFKPILDHIASSYPVQVNHTTQYSPNYYDWWKAYYSTPGAAATTDSRIGNRFLDEKALTSPSIESLARTLRAAYPTVGLLFNVVSGPGVWNAKPAGGPGSMTPAWRSAIVELIVPVTWNYLNFSLKATETNLLTNDYLSVLRKLAPDTGCYLNEADVNEPDLPQAFWGDIYPTLLSIKRKYDPQGVSWCAPCVGSQHWKLDGGQLCRA